MCSASARRLWLGLAFVGIGGFSVPHAQAAPATDTSQIGTVGIVVDNHPQQRDVIEFERRVVNALNRALADVADEGFVVSYSDRVELVMDATSLRSGYAASNSSGASGSVPWISCLSWSALANACPRKWLLAIT